MGRVSTKEAIKELKRIKTKLSKKYHLNKILLFGSRARGDELQTSDLDLIVVSKDFKNIPFKKRPDDFLDEWRLPIDFEVICYTPKEFNTKKKEYGIVMQAIKEGKLL